MFMLITENRNIRNRKSFLSRRQPVKFHCWNTILLLTGTGALLTQYGTRNKYADTFILHLHIDFCDVIIILQRLRHTRDPHTPSLRKISPLTDVKEVSLPQGCQAHFSRSHFESRFESHFLKFLLEVAQPTTKNSHWQLELYIIKYHELHSPDFIIRFSAQTNITGDFNESLDISIRVIGIPCKAKPSRRASRKCRFRRSMAILEDPQ